MIRWTTPTLNIKINPSDIEIEKVILSLFDERNCKLLEFEIPQSEITDGAFTVTLTQEQYQSNTEAEMPLFFIFKKVKKVLDIVIPLCYY